MTTLPFSPARAGQRIKDQVLQRLNRPYVRSVTLMLTGRCNLRCPMCDIWKTASSEASELSVLAIERLLRMKALNGVTHVNFTGGEPFLRRDLCDVYCLIKKIFPLSRINISTNGALPEAMERFFSRVPASGRLTVEISLSAVRDCACMTGDKESFSKVRRSVQWLKTKRPDLSVRAKFVLTPWNIDEILPVTAYCEERGIPLSFKLVENEPAYTNALSRKGGESAGRFKFSEEQKVRALTSLARAARVSVVRKEPVVWLTKALKGGIPPSRCFVPDKHLFVNADGRMYRCRKHPAQGSLFDEEGENIFSSPFVKSPEICQNCFSYMRQVV